MIPVEINVVYLVDKINPRIIQKTFRACAEYEFYTALYNVKKIFDVFGFKDFTEETNKIIGYAF